MEMKTVKAVKSSTKNGGEGDKEGRLREVLGASGSPEEALLKRCAHFDLEGAAKSAHAACEAVVQVRHTQLRDCEQELLRQIQKAQVGRLPPSVLVYSIGTLKVGPFGFH